MKSPLISEQTRLTISALHNESDAWRAYKTDESIDSRQADSPVARSALPT
jgi:hypothetical protein